MRQFTSFIVIICSILLFISCQKNESEIAGEDTFAIQRTYPGEEAELPHTTKVKDYDFLVNSLEPIFEAHQASSLFRNIQDAIVIETGSENYTNYCFAIEEYKYVTYKVLARFDGNKVLVELGIIRIEYDGRFLEDFYNHRADLNDFRGVITSYPFDDFMSQSRSELEDCIELVSENDNTSGGGVVIITGGNSDTGGTDTNTGGNGTDSDTGGVLWETWCGCKVHLGGKAAKGCKCRKPDILVLVIELFHDPKITSSTRNDYWDCIDILIDCGMISDEEILAKRLENCDASSDPYDIGEGGNDEYPDTEFCEDWLAYRDACLSNNTETNDAWGHFMMHHTGLFESTIADPSSCISTEEMEEIICVKNAIADFEVDNNIELTKTERKAIEASVSCGPDIVSDIISLLLNVLSDIYPALSDATLAWIEENFREYDGIKTLLAEDELDEENINEIVGFIKENPSYNLEYILNNKTELTSSISETWDDADGPFADHPIEDFDETQVPWPNYGPVIAKNDAVIYKHLNYDCHDFSKKQIAKSGYKISSYYLTYVGENSPNNVIHYETIQVFTAADGINVVAIDDALDYLYSALKRNIPVVVGVDIATDFTFNPLTDGTTDHFVVIVGMGTDSKGNYFRFYDSSDSDLDEVTHTENKFYFENNIFEGYSQVDYSSGHLFRIAQIRKSKPK